MNICIRTSFVMESMKYSESKDSIIMNLPTHPVYLTPSFKHYQHCISELLIRNKWPQNLVV